MSWKSIVITGLLCVVASPVWAVPSMTVTDDGLNVNGNRKWTVWVRPDQSLFADNPADSPDLGAGGSLALELGFQSIFTTLVDNAANETNVAAADSANDTYYFSQIGSQINWEKENFGANPFTGANSVSDGLEFTGSDRVFAALGSTFYNATIVGNIDGVGSLAGYVPALQIVTQGAFGHLQYSGAHGAGSAFGRIAQAGSNTDTFAGFAYLLGDNNEDGDVDLDDLLRVKNNFGLNDLGDGDHDGDTDLDDLLATKNRFTGTRPGSAPGGAGSVSGAVVPEPTSILLVLLGTAALISRWIR